jgi:plasmid stabilization system protein ParE
MDLRWSVLAAADLERICSRIEQDNPEATRCEDHLQRLCAVEEFASPWKSQPENE